MEKIYKGSPDVKLGQEQLRWSWFKPTSQANSSEIILLFGKMQIVNTLDFVVSDTTTPALLW